MFALLSFAVIVTQWRPHISACLLYLLNFWVLACGLFISSSPISLGPYTCTITAVYLTTTVWTSSVGRSSVRRKIFDIFIVGYWELRRTDGRGRHDGRALNIQSCGGCCSAQQRRQLPRLEELRIYWGHILTPPSLTTRLQRLRNDWYRGLTLSTAACCSHTRYTPYNSNPYIIRYTARMCVRVLWLDLSVLENVVALCLSAYLQRFRWRRV